MILVRSMIGLGDAFAARPTIAALARNGPDLALATPWPEVFQDLAHGHFFCGFVKPNATRIRCAYRNIAEQEYRWMENPKWDREVQLSYRLEPGCKSIPEQIAASASVLDSVRWDDLFMGDRAGLPPMFVAKVNDEMSETMRQDIAAKLSRMKSSSVIVHPKDMEITRVRDRFSRLGVFRIPTIRTEYHNVARNPAPGLVAAAVDAIGGDWIHLNDISGRETYSEDESEPTKPGEHRGHASAIHGELSLPSLLDLVSRARCCVTPISWMAWAALAYGVPTLTIFGGYCSPRTIFGPLLDIAGNFNVIEPEAGCWCYNPVHQCEKSIPVERVKEAAKGLAR